VRKVPAKYQNDPVLRNVAERCLDTIYVKAGSTITMKYVGGWDGRSRAVLYLALSVQGMFGCLYEVCLGRTRAISAVLFEAQLVVQYRHESLVHAINDTSEYNFEVWGGRKLCLARLVEQYLSTESVRGSKHLKIEKVFFFLRTSCKGKFSRI
jgi:hypothetical protein